MSTQPLTVASFTDIVNGIKQNFQSKIDELSHNVTEGLRQIGEQSTEFFRQLKGLIDKNASDINVINGNYQRLQRENTALNGALGDLRKRIEVLERDSLYKTDHSFRLQLVAYNIPEVRGEDTFAVIRAFLVDNLQVPANNVAYMPIRDTHRIGRRQDGKIRPIVVAFCLQQDVNFVMKHAKNLRGSRMSIEPHLSAPRLAEKRMLLAKRKTIKEHDRRILAFIGYRSYRPVLLVKRQGELESYSDNMDLRTLEYSTNTGPTAFQGTPPAFQGNPVQGPPPAFQGIPVQGNLPAFQGNPVLGTQPAFQGTPVAATPVITINAMDQQPAPEHDDLYD